MQKQHLSVSLALAAAVVAVAATPASAGGPEPPTADDGGFNQPGNILIADQFNNRAIEVNRQHHIVWSFGNGSKVPGPHSIVGLNDAERVGELTLLAGTGAPPAPSPTEPGCETSGCPDNRVILVDEDGQIVWSYGKPGITGSGPDELNTPVFAAALPGPFVLITDQGNSRVIAVDAQHEIVWQYGTTGVPGSGPNHLNNPNSAELLANGDVLIADENNNRVIEVNRAHQIVWHYGNPTDTSIIHGAAFASRLPNGDTLVTDTGNSRVLEVTPGKKVVWKYITNTRPGSVAEPLPTRAVRLANGDTLISDQFNGQVIEVNHAEPAEIKFSQGMIGVAGTGFDQLNAPYDAKQIGDYTGLTPPDGFLAALEDEQ
jgi:outer membrane protein assembly factor BamB